MHTYLLLRLWLADDVSEDGGLTPRSDVETGQADVETGEMDVETGGT